MIDPLQPVISEILGVPVAYRLYGSASVCRFAVATNSETQALFEYVQRLILQWRDDQPGDKPATKIVLDKGLIGWRTRFQLDRIMTQHYYTYPHVNSVDAIVGNIKSVARDLARIVGDPTPLFDPRYAPLTHQKALEVATACGGESDKAAPDKPPRPPDEPHPASGLVKPAVLLAAVVGAAWLLR